MQDIDNNLIIQVSEGNMEAFEQIYRKTSPFVYSVVLRITNNEEDARDVIQDVFIKIYKKIKSFNFRSSFNTWLYRIAVNTALNALKKRSIEMNRRGDYDIAVETVHDTEHIDKTVEEENQRYLLKSLLEKLNPDQRACIVLREIEGMDYREIAETLHITINTVRSRLNRARLALLAHRNNEVIYNEV